MRRVASIIIISLILMVSSSSEQAEAFAADAKDIPQLPPPDPDSNLPSIRLGETIRLEEMGPIILNTDGTTRRIENWDQLTKKEQEVTWRRISKRNEERRKVLMKEQEEMQKEKDGGDTGEEKEL